MHILNVIDGLGPVFHEEQKTRDPQTLLPHVVLLPIRRPTERSSPKSHTPHHIPPHANADSECRCTSLIDICQVTGCDTFVIESPGA